MCQPLSDVMYHEIYARRAWLRNLRGEENNISVCETPYAEFILCSARPLFMRRQLRVHSPNCNVHS